MTVAYLLIKSQEGRSHNVLGSIRAFPEVVRANVVTGFYDVIAVVEAPAEELVGVINSIYRQTAYIFQHTTSFEVPSFVD